MNPRRPSRAPGGASRGTGGNQSSDDSPAQTNLGLLLQQALKQAQQNAEVAQTEQTDDSDEARNALENRAAKPCANCWNALTAKDTDGRMMARCGKDLWVRASYTLEDLNGDRVRRWYADCPEYDDTE